MAPLFLTKIDALGNILWSKEYYSGHSYFPTYQAQQTKDHGFILYGISCDGDYLDGETDIYDFYFTYFKTDSVGNIKWTKKPIFR